jgi:zinc transporter 2
VGLKFSETTKIFITLIKMEKETRLLLAIVLSFLFMTVEFIGGYIANSIAIYSDAAHLLTDVAGFLIALIATMTAKHKGSRHLTYGYVRAEVFGALFSIISLWIITAYLFYEASRRTLSWFRGNGEAVDGFFMFVVAVFGIMVNISLGLLFQDEHGGDLHPGHSHDHAHGSAIEGHHDDNHGHHDDNHGHHDDNHGHHDHHHNHNVKPTTTDSTEASPLLTIGSHNSSNTDAQPFAFVKQQQRHDHDHDHKPVSDKHEHEHKHEHSSHVDLESYQNEGSATTVHPHPNTTSPSSHGNHDHHNSHDSHGRDVNLEAAYMHVITDLIQSIGVAIAGAILWRYPSFQIIDPMCTFIFGYIALTATIPLTKKIVMILFEGVPSNVSNPSYKCFRYFINIDMMIGF